MTTPLYLVRAVIREEKLEEVLKGLIDSGFTGATVFREVGGMGGEGGVVKIGNRFYEALIPRVVVEVVVGPGDVDKVVALITEKARTGRVGDGRIFIIPVADAVRIRTGEKLG